MYPRFEVVRNHADRVGDALVVIDDELLFQHVQGVLLFFARQLPRAHDGVDEVVFADAAVADLRVAVAVHAEDVFATDADERAVDFHPGFFFGDGDGMADGVADGGDVGDDARFQRASG